VTLNELCQNKEVRNEAVTTSYARTSHLSPARTRVAYDLSATIEFQDSSRSGPASSRIAYYEVVRQRFRGLRRYDARIERSIRDAEFSSVTSTAIAACHGYLYNDGQRIKGITVRSHSPISYHFNFALSSIRISINVRQRASVVCNKIFTFLRQWHGTDLASVYQKVALSPGSALSDDRFRALSRSRGAAGTRSDYRKLTCILFRPTKGR